MFRVFVGFFLLLWARTPTEQGKDVVLAVLTDAPIVLCWSCFLFYVFSVVGM